MNRFRLRVALVLLSSWFLLPAGIAFADGSLYVMPDSGVYSIGDTFDVQVLADSGGQNINAAEADLTFDAGALEVESISTDGSILTSWPTSPHFSNTDGTIGFSGLASQKYNGTGALLITVTFKAIANLNSPAHFESGAILAADGLETNVITTMRSGLYTIQPKEIPADPSVPADASTTTVNGGNSVGGASSSTPESSTDVVAPALINYQTQVSAGERIVVQGSAPANATVSVFFQQGSNKAERTDMQADGNGSFTFVSDTQAQQGVYHLWAFTQGDAGAQSASSNKITINAVSSGAASVALFETTLISNLIPFLALLIFAGLGTGYIFHRHKLEKFKIEQQHKNTSA